MIRRRFLPCLPILAWALILSVPIDVQTNKPPEGCPLNASAPFAQIVMIWDLNKNSNSSSDGSPGAASMGSLITCNAVLTTAYYYNQKVLNDVATFNRLKKWTRFRVIGQHMWDLKSPVARLHPCHQNVTVHSFEAHPKSSVVGERILFDFAVVVMPRPFNVIATSTFPTMFFPTTTLDLVLSTRYVNIQSESYCLIPTPESLTDPQWRFYQLLEVRSKSFHAQCAERLCQQRSPGNDDVNSPACVKILNRMLNASMLCMIPYNEAKIANDDNPDGSNHPNGKAGSPLICNGTTLGISNFIKARGSLNYHEYPQDIYFTITLVRVFPWLIEKVKNHTPQISPFYIGKGLSTEEFPEPSKLTTEEWGLEDFETLPAGDKIFPPVYLPESLAPAIFCWSVFSMTLSTSLLHLASAFA